MTRFVASPDFDPRIAEWLEDDPDHAPEQVLETVLAALPSIPQRRASRLPKWPTARTRSPNLGKATTVDLTIGGPFNNLSKPGAHVAVLNRGIGG